MRILTGIEVDILDDGSLDQEAELLDRLDVVVASVHSKLSMDAAGDDAADGRGRGPTHRPTCWATAPGRLVTGGRGDPAGVEIRCGEGVHRLPRQRHRRRDQLPARAPRSADPAARSSRWRSVACSPSTPTRTRPGQLEFLGYGAQRALDAGVPVERIVNTWPAEQLLEWTSSAD